MVVKATLGDGGSGARATTKKARKGWRRLNGGISHKETMHEKIELF